MLIFFLYLYTSYIYYIMKNFVHLYEKKTFYNSGLYKRLAKQNYDVQM